MRDIRIALSNTVRMLDIQLDIINHDIEMLDEITKIDNDRLDIKAEKHYKHIIRQQLIDAKKSLINSITIERRNERNNKHC